MLQLWLCFWKPYADSRSRERGLPDQEPWVPPRSSEKAVDIVHGRRLRFCVKPSYLECSGFLRLLVGPLQRLPWPWEEQIRIPIRAVLGPLYPPPSIQPAVPSGTPQRRRGTCSCRHPSRKVSVACLQYSLACQWCKYLYIFS